MEDWRLWIEAAPRSRFANVPELLYFYREFDSFRLRNYLRNKQGLISRLWEMKEITARSAAAETARHLFRAAVFSGAAVLGMSGQLVARRNEAATDEDRRDFDEAMRQISALRLECRPMTR